MIKSDSVNIKNIHIDYYIFDINFCQINAVKNMSG